MIAGNEALRWLICQNHAPIAIVLEMLRKRIQAKSMNAQTFWFHAAGYDQLNRVFTLVNSIHRPDSEVPAQYLPGADR